MGAEIAYRIQRNIFDELDAPIMRVSQEDVPMPYNERLEKAVLPSAEKLIAAVKKDLLRLTQFPMPEIQMPKLSDTMTEGTLVAWKKKKGDKVSAGEVIAEIETDKATMEWESPEDGTLTEIYVEEGGKVEVGQRIAFIGEPRRGRKEKEKAPENGRSSEIRRTERETEGNRKARAGGSKRKRNRSAAEEKSCGTRACRPQKQKPRASRRRHYSEEARVKASPVARRIAAELGVDSCECKRIRSRWPRH